MAVSRAPPHGRERSERAPPGRERSERAVSRAKRAGRRRRRNNASTESGRRREGRERCERAKLTAFMRAVPIRVLMTMTGLRTVRDADGVVTLTLDVNPSKTRGGVVVLDAWLIEQIRVTLDAVIAGPAPSGFILESASSRVFVAGADLAEIDALDDAQLHAYLRAGSHAFGLIRALACPSVALVHKAALGGGLELAMHCDALVGVSPADGEKPWRVGLPEAGLGLCPGWGGTQMLPARIDPSVAIRATATGSTWESTAAPHGLFEATAPDIASARIAARQWITAQRGLVHRPLRTIDHANAGAIGRSLAEVRGTLPSTEAAVAVSECVHIGVQNGFAAALEHEQRELTRLRHTAAAQEKLKSFLKR